MRHRTNYAAMRGMGDFDPPDDPPGVSAALLPPKKKATSRR